MKAEGVERSEVKGEREGRGVRSEEVKGEREGRGVKGGGGRVRGGEKRNVRE